jgi:hypothetical protein
MPVTFRDKPLNVASYYVAPDPAAILFAAQDELRLLRHR